MRGLWKVFKALTHLAFGTLVVALLLAGCSGESPEKLLADAKESIDKRDYKKAIIQAKNALQQVPDLPEGRYLLGKAMLQSGDVAGAQVELTRALELKYSADLVVPDLLRARASGAVRELGAACAQKAPALHGQGRARCAAAKGGRRRGRV